MTVPPPHEDQFAAMRTALSLMSLPARRRQARRTSLPAGVELLLQTAVEPAAAEATSKKLDRSPRQIKEAADFFIEQILLAPGGDSYRILGGARESPTPLLRRNFFYLCRWIHADGYENPARPVYLTRLTEAWNNLKTPDRRAVYDQSIDARPAPASGGGARSSSKTGRRSKPVTHPKIPLRRDAAWRPRPHPPLWPGLISRLLAFVFSPRD